MYLTKYLLMEPRFFIGRKGRDKMGKVFSIGDFNSTALIKHHMASILYLCVIKAVNMVAVVGTYQNGFVKLDKDFSSNKPIRVIVTFLDEVDTSTKKRLSLSDFSFAESQKDLEHYKGSFSDTVIEERRSEL